MWYKAECAEKLGGDKEWQTIALDALFGQISFRSHGLIPIININILRVSEFTILIDIF